MTSDVHQQILALEKKRIAAMVAKDLETLQTILADDLSYSHSSGRTDTKASFLDLIQHGEHPYLAVEYASAEVTVLGSAVMVRGRAQITLDGPPGSYPVRFLDVYAERKGAWQLVAWQATRLPA